MYQFEGKTVWVTGSSTGIGRAAAIAFANHGADVVVHGNANGDAAVSLAQEITDMGRKSLAVLGDVADAKQVAAMVQKIEETFGRVDVLVNNAGSMIQRATLEDMDEDLWDRVMDVNLKSVFLVTKAVLPMMKAQGGGRILNLTSIAARNGGSIGASAYATSKGGVSTLTRGMAKEFAKYGILVNAIAPGVILTPFHERFSSPEGLENMRKQVPLGRLGTPEETVGSLLFLASPYAQYITGEIMEINGGQLMD